MPVKIECTKITAATTTPGTDDSGNVATIAAISGLTYKDAPTSDLWSGATSLGMLVQTSDETPVSFQLDSTATTLASGYDYHRVSVWLRCVRTKNDSTTPPPYLKMAATSVTTSPAFIEGERFIEKSAGTPTGVTGRIVRVGALTAGAGNLYLINDSAVYNSTGSGAVSSGTNLTAGNTILGLTSGATATLGAIAKVAGDSTASIPTPGFPCLFNELRMDTGYVYRFRQRISFCGALKMASGQPVDLRQCEAELAALTTYVEVPSGTYGGEITRNVTECGISLLGTGLGVGSYGASQPNFPLDEWVRFDLCIDRNLKRGFWGMNGFPMGFLSWTGTNEASGTVPWIFTLPDWPGFLWHVGAFSTWRELAGASVYADTGLSAVPKAGAAKVCGYSPNTATVASSSMTKLAFGTGTGHTKLIKPLSVASGNRPIREVLEVTTNSTTNSVPIALSGAPIRFGETGYAHIHVRLQFGNPVGGANGDAWSGFLGFNGVASLVFDYSGGTYRLRDYAGNVVATWAKNARILLQLTVKAGRVWAMVSDRSKSWAGGATQTIFSSPITLHPSDAAPVATDTTVSLSGSFTTTVSGDILVAEAVEIYSEPYFLLGNSYVESVLQGAGAVGTTVNSKVGDTNAACRSTINSASLLQIAAMQSDANSHGLLQFPSGRQFQPWAFAETLGLSGKKITDFWSSNASGFDYVFGIHFFQWADDTNDLSAVSSLGTAATVSTTLANLRATIARKIIGNGGWYTWLEQPFPRVGSGSPFTNTGAHEAVMLTRSKTKTALDLIRRNDPNGDRVRILRVGGTDFDASNSIHPGTNGSIQQFIHASAQLAGSRFNVPATRSAGGYGAGLAAGIVIGALG